VGKLDRGLACDVSKMRDFAAGTLISVTLGDDAGNAPKNTWEQERYAKELAGLQDETIPP